MDFFGVNSGTHRGAVVRTVSPPWVRDLSVSSQTLRRVPPPEEITDVQPSCRLRETQIGLIQRSGVSGKVSSLRHRLGRCPCSRTPWHSHTARQGELKAPTGALVQGGGMKQLAPREKCRGLLVPTTFIVHSLFLDK